MTYTVRLSLKAKSDIEELLDQLLDQADPPSRTDILDGIHRCLLRLSKNPTLGYRGSGPLERLRWHGKAEFTDGQQHLLVVYRLNEEEEALEVMRCIPPVF